MSPARLAGLPIQNLIRERTVSTSSPATHVGPVGPSPPSRPVSLPRSASERRCRVKAPETLPSLRQAPHCCSLEVLVHSGSRLLRAVAYSRLLLLVLHLLKELGRKI